jgi:hypothetical protein
MRFGSGRGTWRRRGSDGSSWPGDGRRHGLSLKVRSSDLSLRIPNGGFRRHAIVIDDMQPIPLAYYDLLAMGIHRALFNPLGS